MSSVELLFLMCCLVLACTVTEAFHHSSRLPKLRPTIYRRGGMAVSSSSPTGDSIVKCDVKVLKEGDKIPSAIFKARVRDDTVVGPNPFKWKDISTDDLFANKRCVIFAIPGAFTPTCSTTHLPGYEEKYGAF
jgi:hypothetical protein